jgi:hypothetical protein
MQSFLVPLNEIHLIAMFQTIVVLIENRIKSYSVLTHSFAVIAIKVIQF